MTTTATAPKRTRKKKEAPVPEPSQHPIFDKLAEEMPVASFDLEWIAPMDPEPWTTPDLRDLVKTISKREDVTGVLYDVEYLDRMLKESDAPVEENETNGEGRVASPADTGGSGVDVPGRPEDGHQVGEGGQA